MPNWLIYLLAFSSGFAIMAVELLGGRMLAPYFGGSVAVWGSIITVFMLSLSLGYLAGGRWSLNSPTLRRYGSLFMTGGLLTLPLVFFATPIMDGISLSIADERYGSLLAALALFFLPTTVLGMISPYSVRLLTEDSARSGHVAGRLYFVSTLGSALGTLATSFYLVLYLEVNSILLGLVGILLLGGLAACGYPRTRIGAAWRNAHA
ncbi:MAG: fused MFS/spermidine synthase [Gammaproteobacteria bacterium]|nr:fused MFS/spermidine synthase [Gammaproteobacteria bacterium]